MKQWIAEFWDAAKEWTDYQMDGPRPWGVVLVGTLLVFSFGCITGVVALVVEAFSRFGWIALPFVALPVPLLLLWRINQFKRQRHADRAAERILGGRRDY